MTGDPDREILASVDEGRSAFYPLLKPNGGLNVFVLVLVQFVRCLIACHLSLHQSVTKSNDRVGFVNIKL